MPLTFLIVVCATICVLQILAGNGYLIDQFLKDSTNARTDNYGGSLQNRFRFLKEIIEACQDAIGIDKVRLLW